MMLALDEARKTVVTDFDGERFLLLLADDAPSAIDLLVTGGLFIAPPRPAIAIVGAQAEALAAHAEYRRFARANQARARFYPGASPELLGALTGAAAAILLTAAPRAHMPAEVASAIAVGKTVLAPAAVLAAIGAGAPGVAAETRAEYRAAAGRFLNGR
jgi:hypothetical protein